MRVERKEGGLVQYEIPEGSKSSPCRACGARMWWAKTPAGKNMPVNEDGTPHWATCPEADRFRRGG